MPAAPVAASRRSNRPLRSTAVPKPVATTSTRNNTVTPRTGQAQRRQPGKRFMAEARKNPAKTNNNTPKVLSAASSLPPELANCAAAGTPERHSVVPSVSKRGDLVAFVSALCIKMLRLVTLQLLENFSPIGPGQGAFRPRAQRGWGDAP